VSARRLLPLAAIAAILAASAARPAAGQLPDAAAPWRPYGFVREAATGEPVALARVSFGGGADAPALRSRADGHFALMRDVHGPVRIRVQALGYAELDTLVRPSVHPLELRLAAAPVRIAGVEVRASGALERPIETPETSVRVVTPAEIRRVPAALESDVFRAVQALPGVVSPGVLSSRLLVRGGAADQNLFLLDGYPVLQPYHLGGGFSAFHTEAVRSAEVWTGAPPARHGGALSSVIDVSLKEGNRERLAGTAAVGVVTSSAVLEGGHPRGAWFVGARRTYLDGLGRAGDLDLPYYFYDAYAKGYADVSRRDRLSVLVFLGRDRVESATHPDRQNFAWSNDVLGASWRRLLGARAVVETRASVSRFGQALRGGASELQHAGIETEHAARLAQLRADLRWTPSALHAVEGGVSVERRTGSHRTTYRYGQAYDHRADYETAAEGDLWAAYLQDDVTLSDRLRVRAGLRTEGSALGVSLQPRLAAKYLLTDRTALSAGYAVLEQHGQTMQDPDANRDVYSVDLVRPAFAPGVRAARSEHWVLGLESRTAAGIVARAEAYAKTFSGLSLVAPYLPSDERLAVERVENADGRARGLDLSLSREGDGPVRGWVGYSLAASERTVRDSTVAADLQPRQRFVAVAEAGGPRGLGLSARFEVFEGIPYTPVVAALPERTFDFYAGAFATRCEGHHAEYLYGQRNSARSGYSRRLDVGAARRWTGRRGWKWEVSLSLLNALFDPVGLLRPKAQFKQGGCAAPEAYVYEGEFLMPPIPSLGVRLEF